MRYTPVSLLFLLALGSCASPPKPPGVDESRRRPANASVAVELQSCRSELQNTRIVANESQRAAAAAMASAAQLAQAADASNGRNAVYAVLFPYGSSQVHIGDAEVARLVEDARGAPLIVLRGRTDGVAETTAEGRVARKRAEAVQALLVQAGIEPAHIRTTWQPAGDHAADNELPGGRALNRRVEVEIYRAAPPAAVALASVASPTGDRRSSQPITSEVQHGRQLH
jgi:outer membrane protein OmpA-like peptidoglycan-associated protein